ncbi:MAG: hypothetical protein ACOCRO_07790 [Halanaerobiales bacterium]
MVKVTRSEEDLIEFFDRCKEFVGEGRLEEKEQELILAEDLIIVGNAIKERDYQNILED